MKQPPAKLIFMFSHARGAMQQGRDGASSIKWLLAIELCTYPSIKTYLQGDII